MVAPLEDKPPRPEFDRDTDRAIAALFGPKPIETKSVGSKSVENMPDSHASFAAKTLEHVGRVLNSLVIQRPLSDGFDAERSSEAAARDAEADDTPAPLARRVAAPRAKARRLATSSEPNATLGDDFAYGRLETSAPEALAHVGRSARAVSKTPAVKAKKLHPAPLIPAILSGTVATPSDSTESEAAPEARKSKIMGRYVYGDVPKPGERWKHKLRRKW
jgi:hypothetical protein